MIESDGGDNEELSLYRSPLWMVTQHGLLNDLVRYLDTARQQILSNPSGTHELRFSRSKMEVVRSSFAEMIRQGEDRLHRLCALLCDELISQVHINSVVIGEVATSGERFTLTQSITAAELYSTIDLDLGNRQLAKLRFYDSKQWSVAHLVANVVEYQAGELGESGVHKIVSRIKAEEELWNKVVDEIFDLDALVQKDKKFQHLSRYVKDIFGIKIVTNNLVDVRKIHERLRSARWDCERLSRVSAPCDHTTSMLSFLEVKDYLGSAERKKSGWEALKSVVEWWDKVFEIQVQPLGKYLREREYLTRESHSGFKSQREAVRNQVAEELPLFAFFRDLLRWLFLKPAEPAPVHPGVSVIVVD